MRRLLFVLCLLAAACTGGRQSQNEGRSAGAPPLILISFDGWRWDYDTRAPAPNLRSLMTRGVRAESMIPSFPSKTFPNHYTLVTGLYPGHHGIVANSIKDAQTGRLFTLSNRQEVADPMWWGGEPLWVTVQRAGRNAGMLFWAGSEAAIGGVRPRYWLPYDEAMPGNDRVDQALTWLDLPPVDRPSFITLYFEDTDTAGHDHGPDSPAVRDAITRADGYLGRLLRGLEQRGLLEQTNIVIVSDHGMAAVSNDRVVVLDDYVTLGDAEIVDINPTLGVLPKAGTEDAVFAAIAGAHPRLHVYRRAETPEQWHYRDHPRIAAIVGVMDEGWQIMRRATVEAIRAGTEAAPGGQHGYDPATAESMRALFVAAGPSFRQNATVPAFANVHVYNALAAALGVTPAPNDGDPAIARSLLR